MIDDWDMRHARRDVPPKVWNFIKENGFWGMLISKDHGGLGFSAQAQSLILGKIASRSPDAAIVVMVPNSLGPGELVENTVPTSKKSIICRVLPKGSKCRVLPLPVQMPVRTPRPMRDVGIVCEEKVKGKKTLGIKVTWNKRYITLAPKATLLGSRLQSA